ncbi:MAG TPA: hypothetical protein VGF28_06160 [Thermoanaerobaculia bacterium]|jgi:hypothetical protein
MRRLSIACLALVVLSGCMRESDVIGRARSQLRSAPCGAEVAVSGVAGVNSDPRLVYLGDWVVVSVCQLDTLLQESAKRQQRISLYIEGLDTGNPPVGLNRETGTLTFVLARNNDNKELWSQFLYNPIFDHQSAMRVSVGFKGERPLSRVEGANMTVVLDKIYVDGWTYLWFGLLAAVAVLLVLYARQSDMLREGPSVGDMRQPYSLARTQMAWWFLLTLLAYVFIWLVTGDRDSIAPSLLGLMGISAVTALAAVAMSPSGARQAAQRKPLDEGIASIDEALADLGEQRKTATAEVLPALDLRAAELAKEREQLVIRRANVKPVSTSSGWWRDLVSDDRGAIALDRFQIVVWTVVLGGVFLNSVIWELTMPDFSATMLALMGVSSGTYIGFKLPMKSGGAG